jgi:hypothetical protein
MGDNEYSDEIKEQLAKLKTDEQFATMWADYQHRQSIKANGRAMSIPDLVRHIKENAVVYALLAAVASKQGPEFVTNIIQGVLK